MASTKKKMVFDIKNKWFISGVVTFIILTTGMFVLLANPSAESVFKDMNDKMLETKSVTIDQSMEMNSADGSIAKIDLNLYMDMKSNNKLLASGDFTMDVSDNTSPINVSGNLIKIGDDSYTKYTSFSSTSSDLSSTFDIIESNLKNKWIKVRTGDQFASFATTPVEFLSSILPTPFANLNNEQKKDVVELLRDEKMYTIEESSKVDTAGVSAYKYLLKYDKEQYNKVAKTISGYVSYFKSDSDSKSEVESLTVWVNIETKQIIKIEFVGSSSDGDVTGTFEFSDYNKVKTVEKPSDYFIESELLN